MQSSHTHGLLSSRRLNSFSVGVDLAIESILEQRNMDPFVTWKLGICMQGKAKTGWYFPPAQRTTNLFRIFGHGMTATQRIRKHQAGLEETLE
jgi:hypothetical protein